MTSTDFLRSLKALRLPNTFNPYAARCALYDHEDAPERRFETLRLVVKAACEAEIDSIWIGRDLGYRGGRRTGLALTDDLHVSEHANRWGVAAERATKGDALTERTAAVIWRILVEIPVPIFLWNVFPLHPHEPGDPFSNRRHNATERAVGEELLAEVMVLLKPKRLVALGQDAAESARRFSDVTDLVCVRHPSYGGQTVFEHQVRGLYRIRTGHQGRLLD
jgi:hypothetical protein